MNNKILQNQVNEILDKLNPEDFHEPINWGDLRCVNVEEATVIYIEEASPDCQEFQEFISSKLSEIYPGRKITVRTEW